MVYKQVYIPGIPVYQQVYLLFDSSPKIWCSHAKMTFVTSEDLDGEMYAKIPDGAIKIKYTSSIPAGTSRYDDDDCVHDRAWLSDVVCWVYQLQCSPLPPYIIRCGVNHLMIDRLFIVSADTPAPAPFELAFSRPYYRSHKLAYTPVSQPISLVYLLVWYTWYTLIYQRDGLGHRGVG